MTDWRDRQVERADAAYATPFRTRVKAKYRTLRSASELRALAAECRKERDQAVRQANKVCNMTQYGTHRYDSWSYLADAARDYAEQFDVKAERIEMGAPIVVVLPHLAKSA